MSNSKFDDFFAKNMGKEFVDFKDYQNEHDPEIKRRTKLYHLLQNYRRRFKYQFLNEIFIFFERCLLALQIVLHINRVKNLNWKIKLGSEWFSITDNLVKNILKNESKLRKIFKLTNCSDELLVQTVAFNGGFMSHMYHNLYGEDNMRLVDFSRGKNGSPYTFTIYDKDLLRKSNALIARKFSIKEDSEIVDWIIKETK